MNMYIMSGSAALASVKRRRSGVEQQNIILEENNEQVGDNKMELSPIDALNLHEQKLDQLFNFHLADLKRISDLEELVKELCNQHNTTVDEMEKFDKTFKQHKMTSDGSIRNLETQMENIKGGTKTQKKVAETKKVKGFKMTFY